MTYEGYGPGTSNKAELVWAAPESEEIIIDSRTGALARRFYGTFYHEDIFSTEVVGGLEAKGAELWLDAVDTSGKTAVTVKIDGEIASKTIFTSREEAYTVFMDDACARDLIGNASLRGYGVKID